MSGSASFGRKGHLGGVLGCGLLRAGTQILNLFLGIFTAFPFPLFGFCIISPCSSQEEEEDMDSYQVTPSLLVPQIYLIDVPSDAFSSLAILMC